MITDRKTLRLIPLCSYENGKIRVGIFPEPEKVFVGSECPGSGSIGLGSLRNSYLQGKSTRYASAIPYNPTRGGLLHKPCGPGIFAGDSKFRPRCSSAHRKSLPRDNRQAGWRCSHMARCFLQPRPWFWWLCPRW